MPLALPRSGSGKIEIEGIFNFESKNDLGGNLSILSLSLPPNFGYLSSVVRPGLYGPPRASTGLENTENKL